MTTYFDILPTELVDLIYQKKHDTELKEWKNKMNKSLTYLFDITNNTFNYNNPYPLKLSREYTSIREYDYYYTDYLLPRFGVWDYNSLIGMINVFSNTNIQSKLKYQFKNYKTKDHVNIYKRELLKKLFDDNGKKFVKTKSVNVLIGEWLKF